MIPKRRRLLAYLALVCLGLFLWVTPTLSNLWLLATGNGYEIPEGSSLFTFRPTVMNQGSGDWWIYGHDNKFYYFMGEGEDGVRVFPVPLGTKLESFDPQDVTTWPAWPPANEEAQ